MDLDGDGHDDIISGSYWPGNMFLFRGKADGSFEKGEILKDLDGKNLNAGGPWLNPERPDLDSLAASPFAFDDDGDGDLDLFVGNIAGRVILIPNEGTAQKPAFNPKNRRVLEADGKPIKVGGGDAGPFVADWDQDGKPDLLVGTGSGSVVFYRNIGTRKQARYAEGVELLPASDRSRDLPPGQPPKRPGVRCKICVTDWNGDGRLDLLVGDYWRQSPVAPKLTPEQVQRLDELKARRTELNIKLSDLYRRKEKPGKDEGPSAELNRIRQEARETNQEIEKLQPGMGTHGTVWLYLRKAASTDR